MQTTLYYVRAVLKAVIGYQGMHLPYWKGQLEEVEGEVRRLIRGYEGIPTEVQMGSDRVRGLQEEDAGVAVSFRMTDTGRPQKEAPIVPVGHKCGESARRIRLTVPRVASGQGMVPGSGAGVPGAGQGKEGQGIVTRGGGDERLEGQDGP